MPGRVGTSGPTGLFFGGFRVTLAKRTEIRATRFFWPGRAGHQCGKPRQVSPARQSSRPSHCHSEETTHSGPRPLCSRPGCAPRSPEAPLDKTIMQKASGFIQTTISEMRDSSVHGTNSRSYATSRTVEPQMNRTQSSEHSGDVCLRYPSGREDVIRSRRRPNRARRERNGTPQGAPITPECQNILVQGPKKITETLLTLNC